MGCQLYRIICLDPHSTYRSEWLGYLGETGRLPIERLAEHLAEKPFRDTIVRIEIDPTVYPDKVSVMAAEAAAIRAERPLYNVEHNMDNPLRIPPWEQRQQAADRGRVAPVIRRRGVSVPSAGRGPRRRSPYRQTPRTRRPWWRSPWARSRWTWRGVAWLIAAVGLWTVSAPHAPDVETGAMAGAIGASLLVGFASRKTRRRRRRRPATRRRR